MKHMRQGVRSQESKMDKASLLKALADTDHPFTKDELEAIISNEFFNDNNKLDIDLVDTAVMRMLLLDGIELNEATLQQERERMIYGVLRRILKPRR